MTADSSRNRWVFREGRSSARGETVRAGLSLSLSRLRQPTRDRLIDALIRAGELETALADAGSDSGGTAADITQSVAGALLGSPTPDIDALSGMAESLPVAESIQVSTPEGFAYYAVHPLAYAEAVNAIGLTAGRAAVIGIRSIGSTLSAIVTAALVKNGVQAERITVRPQGHVFDRKTEFSAAQLRWIEDARHHGAEFLVVDEGPGLSGSSFLSVGESLLSAGIERWRIRFLCSYEPDPAALSAPRAAERWRGFQSHWAKTHCPAAGEIVDVSAGKWRSVFPTSCEDIPSWIQMERPKFLSRDGKRLFKFVGLGRFGGEVASRAEAIAASGFGPRCFGLSDGYAEYEMLSGRPTRAHDLSRSTIERVADYCAMRAAEFRVSHGGESPLEAVARYNYEQEFGRVPDWLRLDARHPVVCDGRMQPHEWILEEDRLLRKTDGDTHGDDHFFPGPTDIAWDLAGAIVEWQMSSDAEQALLGRFFAHTGDDVRLRTESFVLAYAAFRIGFCRMGAAALAGSTEEPRLVAAAETIRTFIANRNAEAIGRGKSSSTSLTVA